MWFCLALSMWVLAHRCSNHPICRLPGKHWRKEDWNWRQQLGSRMLGYEDLGGSGERAGGSQGAVQLAGETILWITLCSKPYSCGRTKSLRSFEKYLKQKKIPLLVDSHLNTLRTGLLSFFSIVVEATTKIINLLLHHLLCKACSKQP